MIDRYHITTQNRVNVALTRIFRNPAPSLQKLYEVMQYSVMNGGKRIRPLLVYASCEALGGSIELADAAACAVEMIHGYSLIHDDLPSMDNSDLRRGRPTTHKVFGEAHAILAGDGLQSLAFNTLLDPNIQVIDAETRIQMALDLSLAAGVDGMVGGQFVDLESVGKVVDGACLEHMYRKKTGALIEASVHMGALSSGEKKFREIRDLRKYSRNVGLAFQIQDDILDVESNTEVLGKNPGSDSKRNKQTYPSLLGLKLAKKHALSLAEKAIDNLKDFDHKADQLRNIAQYIVQRSY